MRNATRNTLLAVVAVILVFAMLSAPRQNTLNNCLLKYAASANNEAAAYIANSTCRRMYP